MSNQTAVKFLHSQNCANVCLFQKLYVVSQKDLVPVQVSSINGGITRLQEIANNSSTVVAKEMIIDLIHTLIAKHFVEISEVEIVTKMLYPSN